MNRTLGLVLLALGAAGAVLALAPHRPARPEEEAALRSGGATGSSLARGWFRIRSGTVYSSDGQGHVCGYASWEQFVSAGGNSGTWTQLEALPLGLINDGVCPDSRSRLPKGWFRIPSGTVYSSDGNGHVCGCASWEHFARAGGSSGAWTQLETLPSGLINDGACPNTLPSGPLAKGWFRIPSGTVYSSDGNGHVCGYASWEQFVNAGGSSGAWTELEALPSGLVNDGVCPDGAARRQPGVEYGYLSRGWFRIPSGTVYSSDGRGHVCGYASWEQYVRAGGTAGAWTQLQALPGGLRDDGVCP